MPQSWMTRYLKPLVGATILSAGEADNGDGEVWPQLLVKTAEGEVIVLDICQDEEGNGPGWIDGLPFPENPLQVVENADKS